ncbi:type II secretion system protein N [Luteimonas sp. MJ204]|uniref:type II secretion system protein N n=1 Tax=Luteimonas sp. MJ145 TaxID=3129234 RepID=UPI0031BBC4FB
MSGRRLAAWFAGAFAAALLLAVPLQLLLPRLPLPPGLTAVDAGGSLWRGELRELRWNGAALGDVRTRLSPLPLLTGRQRLWLHAPEARLALNGGRLRGIDGGSGLLPLPAPQGLGLRASLEDVRLLFDGEACREAGGRVRIEATLPGTGSGGQAHPPMLLSGSPACEGRTGSLTLLPEATGGPLHLEATLAIEADGRYTLQTLARSDEPALRLALQAAGFQEAPGGLSRVDTGQLGG